MKNLRHLIKAIVELLPQDNKSGSLMNALLALFKAKKLTLDEETQQVEFDREVTWAL